ncbi:MAG: hypothetical protein COT17_07765 [Elusimicrobia bacterium CG08_land_8_20_14_0_20_51_18]|nr:MAG: hypothetical protein COT17_07765 [Elusimicrobia bacterium CG08_land_8_20_14_0_20_51_18]
MPVALYRIDDRLIHGQVVEGWVPEFKITEIAVVSESLKNDLLRQNIMRFSTPENIKLNFLDSETAMPYLSGTAVSSRENILVLFPGLSEAASLVRKGLELKFLNIGGMHYSAGKNFSIGKAIFLNQEDCDNLKFLDEEGVKMEGKGIPHDKPVDILESIR